MALTQIDHTPPAPLAQIERGALIARLTRRGRIAEHDVAALRRMIEDSGSISREEAAALMAADAVVADKADAWTAFLIEAVTDHLVWQSRPTGVLSGPQAEWLLEAADRCEGLTAIGILANVLAESHRAPLWFVAAVRARAARTLGPDWMQASAPGPAPAAGARCA